MDISTIVSKQSSGATLTSEERKALASFLNEQGALLASAKQAAKNAGISIISDKEAEVVVSVFNAIEYHRFSGLWSQASQSNALDKYNEFASKRKLPTYGTVAELVANASKLPAGLANAANEGTAIGYGRGEKQWGKPVREWQNGTSSGTDK